MEKLEKYKKRFYVLMESTIGDVKPLLNEQESLYDGTIDENGFEGTYKGLEGDDTGDVGHRYINYATNLIGKKLKELYNQGKYSKVDLNNIVLRTKNMDNRDNVEFYIKIPIISASTKCDAYTSFDRRGGWGHGEGDKLNDLKRELASAPVSGTPLDISRMYKTTEGLVEYFAQWKNKDYQSECGTNQDSIPTSNEKSIEITHNNDAKKLRTDLKNLEDIYNPEIYTTPEKVTVKYDTTGSQPVSLSYIYSNADELQKVLDNVKLSNTIINKIPYNVTYPGYIITIKRDEN